MIGRSRVRSPVLPLFCLAIYLDFCIQVHNWQCVQSTLGAANFFPVHFFALPRWTFGKPVSRRVQRNKIPNLNRYGCRAMVAATWVHVAKRGCGWTVSTACIASTNRRHVIDSPFHGEHAHALGETEPCRSRNDKSLCTLRFRHQRPPFLLSTWNGASLDSETSCVDSPFHGDSNHAWSRT